MVFALIYQKKLLVPLIFETLTEWLCEVIPEDFVGL